MHKDLLSSTKSSALSDYITKSMLCENIRSADSHLNFARKAKSLSSFTSTTVLISSFGMETDRTYCFSFHWLSNFSNAPDLLQIPIQVSNNSSNQTISVYCSLRYFFPKPLFPKACLYQSRVCKNLLTDFLSGFRCHWCQ